MIERKLLAQKAKEFYLEEFVDKSLKNVGHSKTRLLKTPVGEKIIIYASRPGLVVGRKGENIKKLTATVKRRFRLENPQVEIVEVTQPQLDAMIVAERIASTLERFGVQKFKGVGHRTIKDVLGAGARGIEIVLSGKLPSARAKRWRFYAGYLKKSGDIAREGVRFAKTTATLKSGTIGIQVRILPPETILPDAIEVKKHVEEAVAAVTEAEKETKPAEKEKAEGKEKEKEKSEKEKAPKKRKRVTKKKEKETKTATKEPETQKAAAKTEANDT